MSAEEYVADLNVEFMKIEKTVLKKLEALTTKAEERKTERRKILRRMFEEMALVLDYQDSETVKSVRNNVFSKRLEVADEADELLSDIKESSSLKEFDGYLMKFNETMNKMAFLCEALDLDIAENAEDFRNLSEEYIFVKSKKVDPKSFKMYINSVLENNMRVIILAPASTNFRNDFVLSSLEIRYYALNPDRTRFYDFPIFSGNLADLLKTGKAELTSDTKAEIKLNPSPTRLGMVEVKLLGAKIKDGGNKSFSEVFTPTGAAAVTSFLMDISWNRTLSKFDETRMVEVTRYDSHIFDETTTVPCDLELTCERCADESCINYESYLDQQSILEKSYRDNLNSHAHEESIWRFDESSTRQGVENDAEDSIWEPEPEDPSKFRFGSGNLKEVECFPVRELARSCTRTICCLEHPAFFAYEPTKSLLLISEPKRNRIGVFDANTSVFKSWFSCPDHTLRNPRNMVIAGNYLAILQSNGINIFLINENVFSLLAVSCQFIPGCFSGLCWVEATQELASVKRGKDQGDLTIRRYKKDLAESVFIYIGSIEIQVLDNKRGTGFSPEELVYFDQTFFVVDSSAARIYSIDVQDNMKQKSSGYYGEGVGRFTSPSGILVDDMGFLLLSDSTQGKLLLFHPSGAFIKEMNLPDQGWNRNPRGMIRLEKCILVAFEGSDEYPKGPGGFIRYEVGS